MSTDYQRIRAATRVRRRNQSIDAMVAVDPVAAYTALVNRGRYHDEIRDTLFGRVPDIEQKPSRGDGGNASRVVGRCGVPESAPHTILFIMRVSLREAVYPVRLQGASVIGRHGHTLQGKRYPRKEFRAVRRYYQLCAFDAELGQVRVVSSFTNKADARDAMRKALAPAT